MLLSCTGSTTAGADGYSGSGSYQNYQVTVDSAGGATASDGHSSVSGYFDGTLFNGMGDCAGITADGMQFIFQPTILVTTTGWNPGGLSDGGGEYNGCGPDYSLLNRHDGTSLFGYYSSALGYDMPCEYSSADCRFTC